MKEIDYGYVLNFEIPANYQGGSTDFEELMPEYKAAVKNRVHVLEAALGIETMMAETIATYFFGKSTLQGRKKRILFRSTILGGMCDVGAKLKMFLIIGSECGFTSKELHSVEAKVHAAMGWRNAFAHGTLKIVASDPLIYLSYFKKMAVVQPLTDQFLTDVETALREARIAVSELGERIEKSGYCGPEPQISLIM